jgi:phage terminase large subunit-like protein
MVRYWDLAATEKTERNDPDWTVGIKLGRDRSGSRLLGLAGKSQLFHPA